jgi:hypothetical protein
LNSSFWSSWSDVLAMSGGWIAGNEGVMRGWRHLRYGFALTRAAGKAACSEQEDARWKGTRE